MRRLLIVSCSAKKNPSPQLMAAIDRYQGAYYQMIKQVPQNKRPVIVILSAAYGFISSCDAVANYNQKLDKELVADFLGGNWQALLARQWDALVYGHYDEIFVAAGELYRRVIINQFYREKIDPDFVKWASGGIGMQRKQLKEWLAKTS